MMVLLCERWDPFHRANNAVLCRLSCLRKGPLSRYLGAVSYTHLDVYKRQGQADGTLVSSGTGLNPIESGAIKVPESGHACLLYTSQEPEQKNWSRHIEEAKVKGLAGPW